MQTYHGDRDAQQLRLAQERYSPCEEDLDACADCEEACQRTTLDANDQRNGIMSEHARTKMQTEANSIPIMHRAKEVTRGKGNKERKGAY